MNIYIYIIFFILGIVFGSFYNVLAYRISIKESIILPSSHCVYCKHKLKFLDLIPIFSYLFLGGKCRYCKKKISIIYPIIELLTGILFVLSYHLHGFSIEMGISIVFSSVALIVIASDIRYMIIEDIILIVGAIFIIVLNFFLGFENIKTIIINGILTFVIVYLIKIIADFAFKKEAMGGGDVKLLAFIGMILPFPMALITLCASAFIAFPYAIYIYLSKKNHILPLGPFLCITALIFYFLKINFNDIMSLMSN